MHDVAVHRGPSALPCGHVPSQWSHVGSNNHRQQPALRRSTDSIPKLHSAALHQVLTRPLP